MAVMFGVVFARLFGMMRGVIVMTVRDVRMVPRLFVISGLMLLGGGAMMRSGLLMMLRCLPMMVCGFFRHGELSF
jgi:hypothetical protein